MKDAKHIFSCAVAHSEAMIVDRILVRVLQQLSVSCKGLSVDEAKQMAATLENKAAKLAAELIDFDLRALLSKVFYAG